MPTAILHQTGPAAPPPKSRADINEVLLCSRLQHHLETGHFFATGLPGLPLRSWDPLADQLRRAAQRPADTWLLRCALYQISPQAPTLGLAVRSIEAGYGSWCHLTASGLLLQARSHAQGLQGILRIQPARGVPAQVPLVLSRHRAPPPAGGVLARGRLASAPLMDPQDRRRSLGWTVQAVIDALDPLPIETR
jgi:hypothetical protein